MGWGKWNGTAKIYLRGQVYADFGTIIRARRKERGLTQKQVAAQVMVEEDRLKSNVADLKHGFAPPRPPLFEEFARVLELNRDLLYLAADIVPPEVAEELRRLTPEEREMAWGIQKVVADAHAEKKRQQARASQTGLDSGESCERQESLVIDGRLGHSTPGPDKG